MEQTAELKPQLQQKANAEDVPHARIGLLGNYYDSEETRLLLTPETCGLLISSGWKITMESDAASSISYPDEAFAHFGVEIADRDTALQADILLSYQPLSKDDLMKLRPGCTLMCMFGTELFDRSSLDVVLSRRICVICLDKVLSHNGVPVFANIVDIVDGYTSIWYAQEAFSFLGGGKGVLIGGVPGITPCEVLIIGEGTRVNTAARAALANGATVTLMDNDMSALQLAQAECGPQLVTCAIHPHPLAMKVRSADVILLDSCTNEFTFPNNLKGMVKKDAFVLDFNKQSPSLSTPRTIAMGIATCLNNLFKELELKGGLDNTLATSAGVRNGVIAYGGQLTNKLVASVANMECVDLEMILNNAN